MSKYDPTSTDVKVDTYTRRKRVIAGRIIADILNIAAIVATFYFLNKRNYLEQPLFIITCVSTAVYLLSRYLLYPFAVAKIDIRSRRTGISLFFERKFVQQIGWLWSGDILLGNFDEDKDIRYAFVGLFGIPVIPHACYKYHGKNRAGYHVVNDVKWHWLEVVYLYLSKWSMGLIYFFLIIMAGGN